MELKLEQVLGTECTGKPTPHIYAYLISVALPPFELLKNKWQRDASHLDNDDWDDI